MCGVTVTKVQSRQFDTTDVMLQESGSSSGCLCPSDQSVVGSCVRRVRNCEHVGVLARLDGIGPSSCRNGMMFGDSVTLKCVTGNGCSDDCCLESRFSSEFLRRAWETVSYGPSLAKQADFLHTTWIGDLIPQRLDVDMRNLELEVCATLGDHFVLHHSTGHSCLAYSVNTMFGMRLPHQVQTLSAAMSLVRRQKRLPVSTAYRFCSVVLTASGESQHHVMLVTSKIPEGYYKYRKDGAEYQMKVYSGIPNECSALEMAVVDDQLGVPKGYCCDVIPYGLKLCSACGVVVDEDGHEGKCKPVFKVDERVVMGVIQRRAIVGECQHKLDITMCLMARSLSNADRAKSVQHFCSVANRATYMYALGKQASESILATWFYCEYGDLRVAYLAKMFPDVDWGSLPVYSRLDDAKHAVGTYVATTRDVVVPAEWQALYTAMACNHTKPGRFSVITHGESGWPSKQAVTVSVATPAEVSLNTQADVYYNIMNGFESGRTIV